MAIENFIIQLYKESVNAMAGTEWMWPESWDSNRKINFKEF